MMELCGDGSFKQPSRPLDPRRMGWTTIGGNQSDAGEKRVIGNLPGADLRRSDTGWCKEVIAVSGPLGRVVHTFRVQTVRFPRILDDAYLRGMMDTNFLGAMGMVRGFRQRGACAEGEVLFFSSVMAFKGQAGRRPTVPAKEGWSVPRGLLALELAGERIRSNCVAPGLVRTPQADRLQAGLPAGQYQAVEAAHPLGLGDPAEVAAAVVCLLSKAARWVTGTTMVVGGGYTAH